MIRLSFSMQASTFPALVVFDLAGTTVHDTGEVAHCLSSAITGWGYACDVSLANTRMGEKKPVAIAQLCELSYQLGQGELVTAERVRVIHEEFLRLMNHHYLSSEMVREVTGAAKLFSALRSRGAKVALDTGFSRDTVDILMRRLGWTIPETIDAVVTSDEVQTGRPGPDLFLEAMRRCHIDDVTQCAHVGDTPSDIGEGHSAGVRWNIAIYGTSHTQAELAKHAPHHLVGSLAEVAAVFGLSDLA